MKKKLIDVFSKEALRLIFFLTLLIFLSTSLVTYLNMKDMTPCDHTVEDMHDRYKRRSDR